jgi:hypothetical protein
MDVGAQLLQPAWSKAIPPRIPPPIPPPMLLMLLLSKGGGWAEARGEWLSYALAASVRAAAAGWCEGWC